MSVVYVWLVVEAIDFRVRPLEFSILATFFYSSAGLIRFLNSHSQITVYYHCILKNYNGSLAATREITAVLPHNY